MLVFTEVSSIKTRWVESSSPCSRIQRLRARATSARSCSLTCRTFFKRDAVALQKPEQCRAAAGYAALVHRRHELVQRPISLLLDKRNDLVGVIVQRRVAPADGFGRNRSCLPPSLMPSNRLNNARAQIRRIGRGHRSPKLANHPPRFCPSEPFGNPDSITPETALSKSNPSYLRKKGDKNAVCKPFSRRN